MAGIIVFSLVEPKRPTQEAQEALLAVGCNQSEMVF